jgi:hypothetical protein
LEELPKPSNGVEPDDVFEAVDIHDSRSPELPGEFEYIVTVYVVPDDGVGAVGTVPLDP